MRGGHDYVACLYYCGIVLFLVSSIDPAIGTIPPHGDYPGNGYETVHQYRRRLGIEFNYTTKWLSPELCRNHTELECQEWDEAFGRRIRSNRKFLTPSSREQLFNTQERDLQRDLQTSEKLQILVILVQWTNHADRVLIPSEDIYSLFNSESIDEALFPTGSISRFFDVSSYGQFEIVADILPWVMTDNSESHYASFGESGQSKELQNAFIPILDALDTSEGLFGYDFSRYDRDQDGVLDMVVFLHSGYAAELGGEDCETGAEASNRIASHASTSIDEANAWASIQGYRLGAYTVNSAYRGRCNLEMARIGYIVHEMTHTMGIPDLYDIEGPLNNGGDIGGIDRYDIMANPNGQMNSPSRPGHYSAWTKIELGWVDPIEIVLDGEYCAQPVELQPDIYKISHNFPEGEYLLLENRQPIPTDFDERFWEPGGILIYHIDENNLNVNGYGNSPRGGPFQDDWPLNGYHYPIALLQRDGLYELEQALVGGHNEDFYFESFHEIGPGNGEAIATSSGTYPNTDSYAFGEVKVTNVVINNFREIEERVMCFDVSGIGLAPPISTESPTASVEPPVIAPPPIATESPTFLPPPIATESPTKGTSGPPVIEPPPVVTESPTQGIEPPPVVTESPSVGPILEPPPVVTESPTGAPIFEPPPIVTESPTEAPIFEPPPIVTESPTPAPQNNRAPQDFFPPAEDDEDDEDYCYGKGKGNCKVKGSKKSKKSKKSKRTKKTKKDKISKSKKIDDRKGKGGGKSVTPAVLGEFEPLHDSLENQNGRGGDYHSTLQWKRRALQKMMKKKQKRKLLAGV